MANDGETPFTNSFVSTPQGMLYADGGFVKPNLSNQGLQTLQQAYANYWYNNNKNLNVTNNNGLGLAQNLVDTLKNYPNSPTLISPVRNTYFMFPSASITPNMLGTAGSPPIGALTQPPRIGIANVAGQEVNSINMKPIIGR